MSDNRTLKVALPKGSLQDPTIDLLAKAGYEVYLSSRGLRPSSNDPELDLYMIRAQEIGRYLGQDFIDCGITGYDWVYENEVDLIDLGELPYSRATTRPTRWVVVVPEDSPIKTPQDLQGKRIATEGVGITKRYLRELGIEDRTLIALVSDHGEEEPPRSGNRYGESDSYHLPGRFSRCIPSHAG